MKLIGGKCANQSTVRLGTLLHPVIITMDSFSGLWLVDYAKLAYSCVVLEATHGSHV